MRIITGTAKGTRLIVPRGISTRPTADRVKESLFSILGERVIGKNVLDIFAGTGALGLEALSRGAKRGVFVDEFTKDIIQKNAKRTYLEDKVLVYGRDVSVALRLLVKRGEVFDLVFLDPPYNFCSWEKLLTFLIHKRLLSKQAYLVLELGFKEDFAFKIDFLEEIRRLFYGKTTQVRIYEYNRKAF